MNQEKNIIGVSYVGQPQNNTVMYITKKVEYLINNLNNVSNCKIFVENNINVPKEIEKNNDIVRCESPQLDYVTFVKEIETQINNKSRKYICENNSYIGENVSIGNNTIIEPGCLIGHDVQIGENAYIKSGTKIKKSIIGDNFISGENSTIGTLGFTMTEDNEGNKIRIPTLGKIIIGNNVEIGALTNISCGSAGDTIIEDNVKIDSLVYIGHDVHLHKNVEIPAGAIIGGFDEIKEGAYVGINAAIKNRKIIGENAIVGMGAVVIKNVEDNQVVIGNPAKPLIKK